MKVNVFKNLLSLLIVCGVFASSMVMASPDNKTTVKAREAVKNAAPHDWHTLAKSAQKCIKKGTNLQEALEWIEASLAIHEASYNTEVLGDYYAYNQLPGKAMAQYSKALRMAYDDKDEETVTDLQLKIAEVKNMTLGDY